MMPGPMQLLLILAILFVILIIPFLVFGPVLKKAGFSKWWSLLMAIPILNFVMIWIFAFVDWPVMKNSTSD